MVQTMPWEDFKTAPATETGMPWEDFKGTTEKHPSIIKNAVKDVVDIGKGLPQATGQAMATAGKMGMDVLTGASVRDYLGQGQPKSNVMQAISEPTVRKTIEGTQAAAIEEQPKYMPATIGATMKEHPVNNIPVQALMMGIPAVMGKVMPTRMGRIPATRQPKLEVIEPSAPPMKPTATPAKAVDMIDTADVLPISLEKTNIQNIATNKYVRDNLKNFLNKQDAELGFEAANEIKKVKPAIRKAQNEFYQKLGIKDSDKVDVNLALAKIQNEIVNKTDYLDDAAINKATKIYDDIAKNTDPKTNTVTFGKLKEITNKIYDLAEDNVSDMGRKTSAGKFFTQIGNALTEAKRTDPRIAKAGGQYSDLMEAEHLINKTFRLNKEISEMRLEGKVNASFRDKNFYEFKKNVDRISEILKKYPETRDLVRHGGFTDKLQLAQLANDITSRRTTTPTGLKRFGFQAVGNVIRIGDPGFQAQLLSKGIEKGFVNPKALAGVTRNYPGLLSGPIKTRIGALKDILQLPPKGAK